ncbi:Ataxin 2-like [Cichlidogyrus casuarinus]|uniref:Ataxin 2-like n=1 Tax=Cichlidogyrus casuarinus TaxID=1844966 RepID=A0ABD2QN07_9PLAT
MKASTTHRPARGNKSQYHSGQKMHHNNYPRSHDDPGVLSPPWSTLWSQFVIGQIGEFTMNNGDMITGLVSAISPLCEFGLQLSQTASDLKSHKTSNSLKYKDISKIIIRDVDPIECLEATGFTDEEISKPTIRTSSADHELVPYFDNNESADHEYDFSSSTEAFTPQEMFRKNEQEFQVVSSFKEDLEGYTTKIDTSAPDYEEKLKHYTKVAAEIEGTTAADEDEALDMENDEEKYSSVYRGPSLQSRGALNRGSRGNGSSRSMNDFQQTGPRRMTKNPASMKNYNGVLAEPNKINGSQSRPYMLRPVKGDLPEDVKVEQKSVLPNQERVSASLSPALSSPKWPEKRSDSSLSASIASISIAQETPAADHKPKFDFDLDAPEFNPVGPVLEPVARPVEPLTTASIPQASLVAYSQPSHPVQSPSQNGSIHYATHTAPQFQTMPSIPGYPMAAAAQSNRDSDSLFDQGDGVDATKSEVDAVSAATSTQYYGIDLESDGRSRGAANAIADLPEYDANAANGTATAIIADENAYSSTDANQPSEFDGTGKRHATRHTHVQHN